MKKVLIITYYWPPAGGPGVQRVLKFAKYLPKFGWQPIILTVKNGEYPAIDTTLENDIPENCIVYKTNSLEPNNLYKKITGMKSEDNIPVAVLSEQNVNWKKKIANWIRLNLFIPDAKIGWIPFAVKQGKKIIEEHDPDIIFSSSPPPTVHLIAKKLAKWSGLKWVADFRDPWTDIYHYDEINKNTIAQNYNKNLEKKVLSEADKIFTVSSNIVEIFKKKTDLKDKISIIQNGYDPDDLENIPNNYNYLEFTISYLGKINNQQVPNNFFRILKELTKENKEFQNKLKLQFIGNFCDNIRESIRENNLTGNTDFLSYLPHDKALKKISKSACLLLLIPNAKNNKGILTGKLFEYMGMGKTIIAIGPTTGDAAKIIAKTNTGQMFEYDDETEIKEFLLNIFHKWSKKISLNESHKMNIVKQYSRPVQVEKTVQFFEQMVAE